jgi:hypothetical protein
MPQRASDSDDLLDVEILANQTELPIEILEKITGMPAPKLGDFRGGEKRRANRVSVSATAELWLNQNKTRNVSSIKIRNISQSGIELICREQLKAGDAFHLRFSLGSEKLLVQCQTVRCSQIGSGIFLVAAVYTQKFDGVGNQQQGQSKNLIKAAISKL